jgi:apolipoprotein N-acyltransferase
MQLLLPALTGIFLAASFPLADQGYLAWVAYIPLLLFVFRTRTSARAFWAGFAAGAIQLFALLIWMPPVLANYGGLSKALAWFAYSLVICMLACYPGAACAITKFLMKRRGDSCLLLLPFVWVVSEYAQSISPFGGFPWLLTAYSQTGYLALMQIADVMGVYGTSFLILWANAALAWAFLRRKRVLSACGPLIAAVALTAGCVIYGGISLRKWDRVKPEFHAAMLQGNLDINEPEEVLSEKIKAGYVRMADTLKPLQVDLLILPESPSPVSFQYEPAYSRVLEDLARRHSLGLVFNNIRYEQLEEEGRYFNSAYFLDHSGATAGVYDKIHLVPFGEYIPLKKLFFFAETITKDAGGFSPGKDFRIVEMRGRPANAIICFEAVFPGLVRRFVQQGSQLIINLTNDRWYGDSSAPYQHLAIARWRAVENRRYLLRAANSGITALIEPSGRIQRSTGFLTEAVCRGRFAFLEGLTPYARYGDVFVFLCAIIVCVVLMREIRGVFEKRRM